jgi:hypothetical protein
LLTRTEIPVRLFVCDFDFSQTRVTMNIFRKFAGRVAVATALLLFAGTGCSSFDREWQNAARQPVPLNSMEGRWEGRWVSGANEHNGKLRCIISRRDDGAYAAQFRATYQFVLHFN